MTLVLLLSGTASAEVNAVAGVITSTGQTATIEVDLIVNVNSGTITTTGQQALIFAEPPITINTNLGTITATGQQASISTGSPRGSRFPANLLGV